MWVKSLLLALVSTMIALLIGIEVVAYWTVWPAAMSSQGDSLIVYDPEIGMVAHRNAHTHLVYPAIADRGHFEFDVYTDDRGARVNGPGLKSLPHVDIVSLGDSFVWGYGLQNAHSYASVVGHELKAGVSNLALAAYGTTESLQVLQRNRDLAPKLVIYGVIAHHYWRNVSPCAPSQYAFCLDVSHVAWNEQGKPYIAPPLSNGVRRLETHVERDFGDPVSWLVHGGDVIFGRAYQGWTEWHEPDDAKKDEAMAYLLREMHRTTQEMGAKLLVVFLTTNYYGPPDSLPGMVKALGAGAYYLDTTEAFRKLKAEGGANPYIVGDGHPNATGHALIAREIAVYVRREGLLPAP
jgi:hypothetical protein